PCQSFVGDFCLRESERFQLLKIFDVGQMPVDELGGAQPETLKMFEMLQRGENLVGQPGVVVKQYFDDVACVITVQGRQGPLEACFRRVIVHSGRPPG
ncbi:MAG TPA: hypothetical protein DCE39_14330, partial [Planctomycetaceae bacterium]|nr:hypothetical protein [Planctomycetaceae bacterium]